MNGAQWAGLGGAGELVLCSWQGDTGMMRDAGQGWAKDEPHNDADSWHRVSGHNNVECGAYFSAN